MGGDVIPLFVMNKSKNYLADHHKNLFMCLNINFTHFEFLEIFVGIIPLYKSNEKQKRLLGFPMSLRPGQK